MFLFFNLVYLIALLLSLKNHPKILLCYLVPLLFCFGLLDILLLKAFYCLIVSIFVPGGSCPVPYTSKQITPPDSVDSGGKI